jgi:pyruvate dehydrogenase E2 component (dihydrolipoamide acetyltransferase)
VTPPDLVLMPSLAEGMEYGLILAWLKKPGDEVLAGESLVEIETDKATMVWAAEQTGFLRPLVGVGDSSEVGRPIASLHATAEEALADAPAASVPEPAAASVTAARSAGEERESEPRRGPRASPLARRIAKDRGVELTGVTGSATGGRIVRRDVIAAIENGAVRSNGGLALGAGEAPGPLRGTPVRTELTRNQELIATRTTEVKSTVPEFGLDIEVDLEATLRLRDELNDDPEVEISVNDMIVKATALTLRRHPKINAAYRGGVIELYPRVNVGIAVATEAGLLVPTVFDADRLSISELSATIRRLVESARSGRIEPAQLDGGTFTVSNLGMFGLSRIFPIIHGGQAGILGVGAALPRIVPEQGRAVEHRVATLSLTGDHRPLNGTDGAEFLAALRALLESPLRMLT